jgi:hypothetical protein
MPLFACGRDARRGCATWHTLLHRLSRGALPGTRLCSRSLERRSTWNTGQPRRPCPDSAAAAGRAPGTGPGAGRARAGRRPGRCRTPNAELQGFERGVLGGHLARKLTRCRTGTFGARRRDRRAPEPTAARVGSRAAGAPPGCRPGALRGRPAGPPVPQDAVPPPRREATRSCADRQLASHLA